MSPLVCVPKKNGEIRLCLSQAYHQLELAPKSCHITIFTTHIGLFRYNILNYGTSSAAEMFQHMLQTSLQGLQGVRNIADDVIIFGKDVEEHNQHWKHVGRG